MILLQCTDIPQLEELKGDIAKSQANLLYVDTKLNPVQTKLMQETFPDCEVIFWTDTLLKTTFDC